MLSQPPSEFIYLDYAATTPVSYYVRETMLYAMREVWGNYTSPHQKGYQAKKLVDEAIEDIARFLKVNRNEIIFTSGATESINQAIKGICYENKGQKKHIITSTVEHKATLQTVQALLKEGYKATFLTPNKEGVITAQMVEEALADDTAIISLIWVNNETGIINPVYEIAALAREHKIPFHVDATQAIPHFKVDASQFDLLSMTGHKCYGPKGIGLLYRRHFPRLPLKPLIDGSGGQLGLRSGTFPNELIFGLRTALLECELSFKNIDNRDKKFKRFLELQNNSFPLEGAIPSIEKKTLYPSREDTKKEELLALKKSKQDFSQAMEHYSLQFLTKLKEFGVERNGRLQPLNKEEQSALFIPSILNLWVPFIHADSLMHFLPELGFAKGSACNSDSTLPSYVLTELGYSKERAHQSIRLSLGEGLTALDINRAFNRFKVVIPLLQGVAQGMAQGMPIPEKALKDPHLNQTFSKFMALVKANTFHSEQITKNSQVVGSSVTLTEDHYQVTFKFYQNNKQLQVVCQVWGEPFLMESCLELTKILNSKLSEFINQSEQIDDYIADFSIEKIIAIPPDYLRSMLKIEAGIKQGILEALALI